MHSIAPLAAELGPFPVPDAGPLFFVALALHVIAGLSAVIAGIVATTARKGPGRHPSAGIVYFYAIAAVFVTATVMAALRWHHDRYLFFIATAAFGLAVLGRWARRRLSRRSSRWMLWHGGAMSGSYVSLFVGFYVDNGPQLPVVNRLPHPAYWIIPVVVGGLLTWRAFQHNNLLSAPRPGSPLRREHPTPPPR